MASPNAVIVPGTISLFKKSFILSEDAQKIRCTHTREALTTSIGS
jgi:hypothetical protein